MGLHQSISSNNLRAKACLALLMASHSHGRLVDRRRAFAPFFLLIRFLAILVCDYFVGCPAFGLFAGHLRLRSAANTAISAERTTRVPTKLKATVATEDDRLTPSLEVDIRGHSREKSTGAGGAPTWQAEAPPKSEAFLTSFKAALTAREPLMRRLLEERTDCYRLFHGAVEGCPGLTVDRYGTVILVQTFREPPVGFGASTVDELCRLASVTLQSVESEAGPAKTATIALLPVWNDRRKRDRRRQDVDRFAPDSSGQSDSYSDDAEEFYSDSVDSDGDGFRVGGDFEQGRDGAGSSSDPATPLPHKLSTEHEPSPDALGVKVGLEYGVRYPLAARHRGIDPWLFLDLRAARKWVLENSKGMEVLNLFSYTGGVSVAAACGGAKNVWSVDFSSTAHEVGRASHKLNAAACGTCQCDWMKLDVLPTVRQLAGIATKDYRRDKGGKGSQRADNRGRGGGGGGGRYSNGNNSGRGIRGGRGGGKRGWGEDRVPDKKEKIVKPRQFDLVFLDPPTWSKSGHGAVDLVRDYQSLFKPSLLATKEGGAVLATNHVSSVDCAEWVESLSRCAAKAGREVESVQILVPEDDFPSPDGRHPLKMAIFRV